MSQLLDVTETFGANIVKNPVAADALLSMFIDLLNDLDYDEENQIWALDRAITVIDQEIPITDPNYQVIRKLQTAMLQIERSYREEHGEMLSLVEAGDILPY